MTIVLAAACQPPVRQRPEPATPARLTAVLRERLEPCWQEQAALPAFAGKSVALEIRMAPDGRVDVVTPVDRGQVAADPVLRALADAAISAVLACSPLNLDPLPYEDWRNVVLVFLGRGRAASGA
jgi:hypothetical protein